MRNEEGLTLEMLALRNSLRWPIYIIDSADKTKLNFPLLLFSCLSFFSFLFFLFFIFALLSFSFLSQGNTRLKVVIIDKLTTHLEFLHYDKKILIP